MSESQTDDSTEALDTDDSSTEPADGDGSRLLRVPAWLSPRRAAILGVIAFAWPLLLTIVVMSLRSDLTTTAERVHELRCEWEAYMATKDCPHADGGMATMSADDNEPQAATTVIVIEGPTAVAASEVTSRSRQDTSVTAPPRLDPWGRPCGPYTWRCGTDYPYWNRLQPLRGHDGQLGGPSAWGPGQLDGPYWLGDDAGPAAQRLATMMLLQALLGDSGAFFPSDGTGAPGFGSGIGIP